MYKTTSGLDGGTLFQIRNLINRRNVITDVSKDMNACEDFLHLTTSAHIFTAAMQLLGAKSVPELHAKIIASPNQSALLSTLAHSICNQYVELNFTPSKIAGAGQLDHVLEYARETLTLGMLFLEFKDSIREGDGNRVLRCWKYFLFLFRASGHVNYCIEAFNLLMQYYYTLTPRLAEQMLWGRFINYEGKPGHNISADLHMEHLNRTCKDAINHLGANKTPNAITRTGKAVCGLTAIVHNFDKLNGTVISGRHTRRSEMEDLIRIIEELTRLEVFATQPGRHHSKFPKFLSNRMLSSVNNAKMNLWMKSNLSKSLKDSHLSH